MVLQIDRQAEQIKTLTSMVEYHERMDKITHARLRAADDELRLLRNPKFGAELKENLIQTAIRDMENQAKKEGFDTPGDGVLR